MIRASFAIPRLCGLSVVTRCFASNLPDQNRKRSPSTLYFRYKRGDDYVEPDIPVKELLTRAPSELAEQVRLLSQELRESVWPKQLVFEATPIHGASMVQWKFDRQEILDAFIVTSDSVRRVGYSTCEFLLSERGTAIFKGNLDLRVPKDGQVFRAGYAAISSKLLMV
ncbi:hypothetical protein M514_14076 [Trichuris suis]|uniref:Uncharacterized protein n=1 Tax=Trichuris suis TaxID=68888 RepID=A0A085MQB1_9BILA|nr:hypothetical protein M513_14076 [Trichuris suis]KFD59407.1 hypothetical protein M514_14076 [Trichuris suis]